MEAMRDLISVATLETYDSAKTYHDGKWLFLNVSNDAVLNDVRLLLSANRRPKPPSTRERNGVS